MSDGIRDRAVGAMVGLAVGDALGTTLEFARRDAGPLHTEITGGGPFSLEPGQWTDDTSMALALADSLLTHAALNERDLMKRFVSWWKTGRYSSNGRCFDIGRTTSAALERYLETGRARAGSRHHSASGNGSIMRLAPAVLFAIGDEELARATAVAQGAVTHGSRACAEASDMMAAMLHRLVTHGTAADVGDLAETYVETEVADIARGTWRGRPRDEIKSTGYVVDTLEAAMWAVDGTSTFEEALVMAVNLGGDADTVGAVTGQIAGARHGVAAIPARWMAVVHDVEGITRIAGDLFDLAPKPAPPWYRRLADRFDMAHDLAE